MIHIERHHRTLEQLGLHTFEGVKSFEGLMIEQSKGRRDVHRIDVPSATGAPVTLFLKRHWKTNRLKSFFGFVRRFQFESLASREWHNAQRLQSAGFKTADLVAYGHERSVFGETFSFLITEGAHGSCSLEEFIDGTPDHTKKQQVLDGLASEVRRLHSAGMSLPDLFTRHVFLSPEMDCPSFCFIDVARLEIARPLSLRQRAKCLAALNVSSPFRSVSNADRRRFIRRYEGEKYRQLMAPIWRRTNRLLRRKRYQKMQESKGSQPQFTHQESPVS